RHLQPAAGSPEVPRMVQENPVAYAEWVRIVPLLLDAGLITRLDGPALALYTLTYARHEAAQAEMRQKGLIITAHTGAVKPNPAVGIASVAADQIRMFLCEFELTPASRSSIKPAEVMRDELAEFFEAQNGKRKPT